MGTLQQDLELLVNQGDGPLPSPGSWQVLGPVHKTAASAIFKAVREGHSAKFAIKVIPSNELDGQYHGQIVASHLLAEQTRFRAPAPIAQLTIQDQGILIMDWIDGQTIQNILHKPSFRTAKIRTALRSAGDLLSLLHQTSEIKSHLLDTADFINDIKIAVDEVPQADPKIKFILHWLDKYAAEVEKAPLSVTTLHGDFKPSNLIHNAKYTCVIDGFFQNKGAVIHDVAQFLNHVAMDFYYPLSLPLQLQKISLEKTFSTSYQSLSPIEMGLPLRWLRLQKFAILYIQVTARKGDSNSDRYLKRCILREAAILQS
jgi:tRNA A-37 threonylcarbamoyl transferase component Bud32